MRRIFAGLLAAGVVGTSGGLGTGTAQANPWYPTPQPVEPSPLVQGSTVPTVYALGGARAPGSPGTTTRCGPVRIGSPNPAGI